jgi:HPr kinase/phosphorylase
MSQQNKTSISVLELIDNYAGRLNLEFLTSRKNHGREITSIRVQKPGLRIIEKNIGLEEGKIQILGKTEINYINNLDKSSAHRILKSLTSQNVPCFILSKGIDPKTEFINYFKKSEIPLLKTKITTGKLISEINEILAEKLAPMKTFHGVLMDIHRLGVLILGKSGIGKSESALDLIPKGAKFIADDIVEIRRISNTKLIGTGPENIKYLMEIRGIGIVNIKDLFGTTSVMDNREIEMVIELEQWNQNNEYERLGIETISYDILDLPLPYVIIPVSPGRNIATIIEVAVRNQILKNSGVNSVGEILKFSKI